MNLSHILHAVARAVPDRPAITAYNGALTYAELDMQVSACLLYTSDAADDSVYV